MPITLNGTTGITTPTYNGNTTAEYLVPVTQFKNRIINGGMVIDQRNAGASVTPSSTGSQYVLDRWCLNTSQASKFSIQQNAGSVTPPAGFKNYLGATVVSAVSVGVSDFFALNQRIEGFNTADLNWGTANAQTITVSFWVRSSLTGTFGASIRADAGSRSYLFSYSISSANTWEQKSVTIPGDTSGTWNTTNGIGVELWLSLGAGTNLSGTANTWSGSNLVQPTGSVSVVGTNGATFYITGVQLEVGSTATSFDYRPYGTELALCQRYYFKTFAQSVAAPSASKLGALFTYQVSNNAAWNARFPVTMRATPTCTPYDMSGNANQCTFSTTNASAGINSQFPGDSGCMVFSGSGSGLAADAYVHLIAVAEL